MPISDEQFDKFSEMLIRIDENVKNWSTAFKEHEIKDISEMTLQRSSLAKVHERIDTVRQTQDRVKWMIAGATALISVVVFLVNLVFSFERSNQFDTLNSKIENIIRHP